MFLLLTSVLFFVGPGNAFFFDGPDWNDLKLTFGVNPFNQQYFESVPRTEAAAIQNSWMLIDGCAENEKFGSRYWLNSDPAAILMFDVNGFIAGIQTKVPKTGMIEGYPQYGKARNFFVEESDGFTATAFFVDPSKVCGTGRNATEYDTEGTGDRLILYNKLGNYVIPKVEAEMPGQAPGNLWVRGRCFPHMGVHYWYDVSSELLPEDFVPYFILYNSGKLNAFGFALHGLLPSPRYEHPPSWAVNNFFFVEPPNFLFDPKYADKLSTMHIYLDSTPRFNFC